MTKITFNPEVIRDYLIVRLKENEDFLFNELDLQMFVVRALECEFKEGYRVHLEYHLPKGWNKDFDDGYARWQTDTPYIDIVLEKTDEKKYIPIELKYKLNKVQDDGNFTRFGVESKTKEVVLVTKQGAQSNARYDFWKDVKRIELIKESYKDPDSDPVIGGIVIFLTNDETYKKYNDPQTESAYREFVLTDEKKTGELSWYKGGIKLDGKGLVKDKKGVIQKYYDPIEKCDLDRYERPNFKLKGEYTGKWEDPFRGPLDKDFYIYSVIV